MPGLSYHRPQASETVMHAARCSSNNFYKAQWRRYSVNDKPIKLGEIDQRGDFNQITRATVHTLQLSTIP